MNRADSSLVDNPGQKPQHGGLTEFGRVSHTLYSHLKQLKNMYIQALVKATGYATHPHNVYIHDIQITSGKG